MVSNAKDVTGYVAIKISGSEIAVFVAELY